MPGTFGMETNVLLTASVSQKYCALADFQLAPAREGSRAASHQDSAGPLPGHPQIDQASRVISLARACG